ncbi:hypothetical protein TFLX_03917 [Thermoflexales bacterium]|nr:hypothetical protein TFLX_03917 [Thermoflexales bacterium]
MLTVDGVLAILILILGIVGIVRGFLRELGVTLVLVATLWALSMVLPVLEGVTDNGSLMFLGVGTVAETQSTRTLLCLLFSGLVVLAAFVSYEGETLSYEGTAPKGLVGVSLSFLIGAVNGYLLFGTLWWLFHRYGYPLGLVQPGLPESAQQFINAHLLPMDLLASGSGPLNLLALALIILVLLKVIR